MDFWESQKSFLIWKLPDPHHAASVERLQKPWYIREFLRLGVKLLQKTWYIRFWDPAKYPTLAKLRKPSKFLVFCIRLDTKNELCQNQEVWVFGGRILGLCGLVFLPPVRSQIWVFSNTSHKNRHQKVDFRAEPRLIKKLFGSQPRPKNSFLIEKFFNRG